MPVPLAASHYQRLLRSIDPAIVAPGTINDWVSQGADLKDLPSAKFLHEIALHSFQNPVQALALVSGWSANFPADDPLFNAAAGIALARWYRYDEALPLLDAASTRLTAPLCILYVEWLRTLCLRRLNGFVDAHGRIIGFADRFEQEGSPREAFQCRLDAVADIHLAKREQELGRMQEILSKHPDWLPEHAILSILYAGTYIQQSDPGRTQQFIARAEQLCQSQNMPMMLAFTWLYRAISRRGTRSARYWLNRSFKRAQGLQHGYFSALCLMEMVIHDYERGNIKSARLLYSRLIDLTQTSRLIPLAIASTLQVANIHYRQGAYQKAADGYRRTLNYATQIGDRYHTGVATMNLGLVAFQEGRYSKALLMLGRARHLFEQYEAADLTALAMLNQGEIYAALGHFGPAFEQLEQSIQLYDRHYLHRQAVRPLLVLAHVLIQCGEFSKAREILAEVKHRAGKILLLERSQGHALEADLLARRGDISGALTLFRKSLKAFQTLGQDQSATIVRLEIAELYRKSGEETKSRKALHTIQPDQLPAHLRSHYLLAKVERAPNVESVLAEYYQLLNQLRKSRRGLRQHDLVEQMALSTQRASSQALDAAALAGRIEEALLLAEVTSADKIEHLPSSLSHAGRFVSKLQKTLDRGKGKDWLILRYLWHGEELWIFGISADGVLLYRQNLSERHRLALRAATQNDATLRWQMYSNPTFQKTLQSLGEALIPEKIRSQLKDGFRLTIIPSKELFALPFHALEIDRVPLVAICNVTYAHSIPEILRLAERETVKNSSQQGLILAQERFLEPGYADLPAVGEEAEWLTAAFRQSAKRLDFLGGSIKPQISKLDFSQYRWLHVGTHTFVDPTTGYSTGLILGDEVITSDEISNWRLETEWVTLSACHTGIARWYFSDETVGLARAFLDAGSRKVIGSFWQVEDKASSILIRLFYSQIIAGCNPVQALSNAQREAASDGMPLFEWGAYGIYGLPD